MANKKILWIIPVSEETFAKWQQTKRKARSLAVPLVIGGTIGAAWGGYGQSLKNSIDIKRLGDCHNSLSDVVNNNANCSIADRRRIEELERQNAVLMREALERTEGTEQTKPAE